MRTEIFIADYVRVSCPDKPDHHNKIGRVQDIKKDPIKYKVELLEPQEVFEVADCSLASFVQVSSDGKVFSGPINSLSMAFER